MSKSDFSFRDLSIIIGIFEQLKFGSDKTDQEFYEDIIKTARKKINSL
jgi:hypothetical protein